MSMLVIQLPCLNEAGTLAATLAELPRAVEGFDQVVWLVIDDGSTDGTAGVAEAAGARVVRHTARRGLAAAFCTGVEHALRLGADVIVNTDGDNQYAGADVPALTTPLLARDADVVLGDRGPGRLLHFSWMKRRLQVLGSWGVGRLAGVRVGDATSGFRAFSREAALGLVVLTRFSWTLETLFLAGRLGLKVQSVPVHARATSRPSRLAPTTVHYLVASGASLARIALWYRPWLTLGSAGALIISSSIILILSKSSAPGTGDVHAGALPCALTLCTGLGLLAAAAVADALSASRELARQALVAARRRELGA